MIKSLHTPNDIVPNEDSDIEASRQSKPQAKFKWLLYESLMRSSSKRNSSITISPRLDPLTGLLEWNAFLLFLTKEMRQSIRLQTPLSLALMDLDDFKRYNDVLGHKEGDQLLKQVASVIQMILHKSDKASRWGGDEFVMMLPGAEQSGAESIAQQLKQAVSALSRENAPVNISIGIAEFPAHARNQEELLMAADDALFRMKTIRYNGNNEKKSFSYSAVSAQASDVSVPVPVNGFTYTELLEQAKRSGLSLGQYIRQVLEESLALRLIETAEVEHDMDTVPFESDTNNHIPAPARTLAEALAGRTGTVHSGRGDLSRQTGKSFTKLMLKKRESGRL